MSTAPVVPPQPRHALGLPAGSVRAILALGVLGISWTMVVGLQHKREVPLAFLYLQFLMMMIFAHYFAAHGSTMGRAVSAKSPLGLPRGTVRVVLLAGYLAMAWFLFKQRSELEFDPPPRANLILFLALILSGFFVGHLLTLIVKVMSHGVLPPWFQDVQAWLSLLSMLGLGALFIIRVFIDPDVNPDLRIGVGLDVVLATLVAFYFGART